MLKSPLTSVLKVIFQGVLSTGRMWLDLLIRVLYMSFDRFLLAVESHDLSQADKIIIRVSSFPKLSH